jgi:hypothetical protein
MNHCYFCCWVRKLMQLLAFVCAVTLASALVGVAGATYLPDGLRLLMGWFLLVVGMVVLLRVQSLQAFLQWLRTCRRPALPVGAFAPDHLAQRESGWGLPGNSVQLAMPTQEVEQHRQALAFRQRAGAERDSAIAALMDERGERR